MINNRMMINRAIICFAIALSLIISIQLVYASESLKKVGEITIIANEQDSTIPAVPQYSDYMDYIHLWDFDRVDELGNIEKESLSNVEPINLEKGTYVLKIVDSSWSRWGSDSIDSSYWSNNRNGGQGKVWETSAAVVYNKNGNLVIDRFGERNLFSSAEEAKEKGVGKTLEIEHNGGAIYILIDDTPITDNRGSVKVNIYKVVEEEEEDDNGDNTNERDVLRGVGFEESMWQCSGWSECNDGVQRRSCTDLTKASTPTNKPNEVLSCEQKSSTEILKISEEDNKQQQQGFNLNLIAWIFGIAVIVLLVLVIIAMIA